MTRQFNSIEHLASCCATDIGIGTTEILHPAFCGGANVGEMNWAEGVKEQRRVVDLVCGLGVTYLESKKPRRVQRDEERYLRRVKRRAERIAKEKDADRAERTGFAPLMFIGMSVLGWVIQQALSWLLNWWRSDDGTADNVTRICAGLPGACWIDDESDD